LFYLFNLKLVTANTLDGEAATSQKSLSKKAERNLRKAAPFAKQ